MFLTNKTWSGNEFITFVVLLIMKSSELLRLLEQDGWYVIRQSGSHIFMGHPEKPGRLSVPFHGAKEVKKGLLRAILNQANIKTSKR